MQKTAFRTRRSDRSFMAPLLFFSVVLLLFAVYLTAYRVGSSSMATRGQKQLDLTADIIRARTERHRQCAAQSDLLQTGHMTAAAALDSAQRQRSKLKEELSIVRDRNAAARGDAVLCEAELSAARVRLHGAAAPNATAHLEELAKTREALLATIRAVNATADVRRQQLRALLGALSREVDERVRVGAARCGGDRRFAVVLDAGSTGSRVHVFRYAVRPAPSGGRLLPRLRLEDERFEENHDALSRFDRAADAADSLRPLLAAAAAAVPPDAQRCTPIELRATAGLRQLGGAAAAAVLRASGALLAQQPFWLKSELDAARILDGREEGPLAWLTVNFLTGALRGEAAAAAVLDLGGGSAQFVFPPADPAALAGRDAFAHTFDVDGRRFVLYQHSHEGGGLHAGKRQVLRGVVASAERPDAFPCFPRGYAEAESGVANTRGGGVGTSFEQCAALIRRYAVRPGEDCGGGSCGFNGVFQPNLTATFSGPVYAFSFFYDRLKPHMTHEERICVREVMDVAHRVCDGMKTAEEIAAANAGVVRRGTLIPEMECFELSYIATLLHDGFGFPLSQELRIAKKINGFETAWALGASLVSMDELWD